MYVAPYAILAYVENAGLEQNLCIKFCLKLGGKCYG